MINNTGQEFLEAASKKKIEKTPIIISKKPPTISHFQAIKTKAKRAIQGKALGRFSIIPPASPDPERAEKITSTKARIKDNVLAIMRNFLAILFWVLEGKFNWSCPFIFL